MIAPLIISTEPPNGAVILEVAYAHVAVGVDFQLG